MRLSTPQLAARFGWVDQYQVLQASSDRRRAPQRLLARAIAGYVEGVLPAQAIATLRGISVEALMGEFGEAGVTPVERPIAWADPGELPDVEVDLELARHPDAEALAARIRARKAASGSVVSVDWIIAQRAQGKSRSTSPRRR